MRGNVFETVMGAIVLAVAVSFLVFVYSRADYGTVKGYELVAKFDRVDGLAAGSDVLVSGIKVGTVLDQRLDTETFQAVVRISIDPSIQLPEDSSAEIGSDGLLGGKYLLLVPGGSPDLLESGDEIVFTQGSIDIINLVGQAIFGKATEETDKAAQ